MNRLPLGVLALSACLLGTAGATSIPTMTIYTKGGGSTVFALPKVTSVAFQQGASDVRRSAVKNSGFRLSGRMGNASQFTLTGVPGTEASLQIVDLSGRAVWAGSTQLGGNGTAVIQVPYAGGGLLVARYRNGTFVQTAPVSMVNGGAR